MADALMEASHKYIPVNFSEVDKFVRFAKIAALLDGATFDVGPKGCWEIRQSRVNQSGYGIIKWPSLIECVKPTSYSASRHSYIAANPGINLDEPSTACSVALGKRAGVSQASPGPNIYLHVHHVCRNERCFRPSHLRPVTPEQNETLKHCKDPHQRHTCGRYFDTFYFRKTIRRRCSVCERAKKARHRLRKKQNT